MQLIVASAALYVSTSGKTIAQPSPTTILLAVVVLISVLMIVLEHSAARAGKHITSTEDLRRDLLLKAIWDAIHTHIRLYREINGANPAESQYPLKAWPKFGEPWREAHASLFAESVAFERTRELMRSAWVDLGWPTTQEVFRVSASTTMTSLLTALEDIDYFLRSKVKVLGT
jgi:hypothetical protein